MVARAAGYGKHSPLFHRGRRKMLMCGIVFADIGWVPLALDFWLYSLDFAPRGRKNGSTQKVRMENGLRPFVEQKSLFIWKDEKKRKKERKKTFSSFLSPFFLFFLLFSLGTSCVFSILLQLDVGCPQKPFTHSGSDWGKICRWDSKSGWKKRLLHRGHPIMFEQCFATVVGCSLYVTALRTHTLADYWSQ